MRDNALFGPTHTLRESRLRLVGCRPPIVNCHCPPGIPSSMDVGSAKQARGHPPVNTGLNLVLHGTRGFFCLKLGNLPIYEVDQKDGLPHIFLSEHFCFHNLIYSTITIIGEDV